MGEAKAMKEFYIGAIVQLMWLCCCFVDIGLCGDCQRDVRGGMALLPAQSKQEGAHLQGS